MPAKKAFAKNPIDQARLAIVVLDGDEYHLRAHYNPHEVQYQHDVGWSEKPVYGAPHLDFDATKARTMTLELFFDCFELTGETLQDDLDALERMTIAPDPRGCTPNLRRPPIVQIVNGPIPSFRCVIESVAVKVTMFDKRMQPVRATATIKLKEIADDRHRDPVSIPRENFLEWTKPEQQARYREAEIARKDVEIKKIGGLA